MCRAFKTACPNCGGELFFAMSNISNSIGEQLTCNHCLRRYQMPEVPCVIASCGASHRHGDSRLEFFDESGMSSDRPLTCFRCTKCDNCYSSAPAGRRCARAQCGRCGRTPAEGVGFAHGATGQGLPVSK